MLSSCKTKQQRPSTEVTQEPSFDEHEIEQTVKTNEKDAKTEDIQETNLKPTRLRQSVIDHTNNDSTVKQSRRSSRQRQSESEDVNYRGSRQRDNVQIKSQRIKQITSSPEEQKTTQEMQQLDTFYSMPTFKSLKHANNYTSKLRSSYTKEQDVSDVEDISQ